MTGILIMLGLLPMTVLKMMVHLGHSWIKDFKAIDLVVLWEHCA